ncbi:copia protein, partial [Lasius niger]
MARCMMRQANVPPVFWAEAVNTACYVRNRCITKSLDGQVPYKLWKGKTPTVIYFKIFGSKVFVLDKNPQKGKFDSRSEEGIFVGYSNESKAYRVWLPKSHKLIVSRDVKFLNELAFDREYQEFIEEEKPNEIKTKEYERDELIQDEAKKHNEVPQVIIEDNEVPQVIIEERDNTEVPQDIITRMHTPRTTEDSTSLPTRLQPSKRGRGRPRLLRSGSVGRPKKLYHMVANNNEENDSDNEVSDDDDLPEETSDDDVFVECNLTITHNPVTW